MSRATLVYIFLLSVCAGGVYTIIRIGAGLHATPDLSGTWDITDAAKPAEGKGTATLTVEQSGRFVQVQFSDGLHLDLKADPPGPPDAEGTRKVRMAAGEWKLIARFENRDPTQAYFILDGPRRATFPARRRSSGKGSPAAGHALIAPPAPTPATQPAFSQAS